MKSDLSPWAYRSGASPLHRLPGALKLVLLLALSTSVFFSPLFMIPASILILAGAFLAGLKPRELLRGSRGLALMALLVILFRSFSPPESPGPPGPGPLPGFNPAGFREGLLFALRMYLSFAAGALFFAVTTMGELRKTLSGLERRLPRRRGELRFSLVFSLMLGFIPRFFALWEESNLAWEARGGGKGPRRLFVLIPLVTERMIEAAGDTACALEARGA